MTGILAALVACAGGGAVVSLDDQLLLLDSVPSGTANSRYKLNANGDIEHLTIGSGNFDLGDWVTPKSAAGAAYEARATLQSGTLSSGTAGSWLSLGGSVEWGVQTTNSVKETTILVEIRDASTLAVLGSATITLRAEGV